MSDHQPRDCFGECPEHRAASDTPRTDALINADWHMPVGWKDRIHEHARQLEREVAALREALERIRDECFSGAAYDIAVRAIGEFKKGKP